MTVVPHDTLGPANVQQTLTSDRQQTDQTLDAERAKTDELLSGAVPEEAVQDVLTEKSNEVRNRLEEVREEVDSELEHRVQILPVVSEKLGSVAESLTKVAASLDGVAGTLRQPVAATEKAEPIETLSQVTNELAETAGEISGSPALMEKPAEVAETSGEIVEQLAEIAGSIAEVTANLADERRDVDEILRKERELTDRIIEQQLGRARAALVEDIGAERRSLVKERRTTDDELAEERRHTDEAVEHVLSLLMQEQSAHDITEQKVASRNEFLAMVTHDLRSPLTTIAGATRLIAQNVPDDDKGRQIRGWTKWIDRSVSIMDRLIRDLLDFASLEDGRLRVKAEARDLGDLVHRMVDAFHPLATAKSLSLEAVVPPEPVIAQFDEHRIVQVLSNLIQNGMKFTPDGGSIRVRAAKAGSECLVAVTDTGVGIDADQLTAIFERFRQLNTDDRAGLGLGLYISKWIVEAHGGKIWAESRPGGGSTFYFTLPAA